MVTYLSENNAELVLYAEAASIIQGAHTLPRTLLQRMRHRDVLGKHVPLIYCGSSFVVSTPNESTGMLITRHQVTRTGSIK